MVGYTLNARDYTNEVCNSLHTKQITTRNESGTPRRAYSKTPEKGIPHRAYSKTPETDDAESMNYKTAGYILVPRR